MTLSSSSQPGSSSSSSSSSSGGSKGLATLVVALHQSDVASHRHSQVTHLPSRLNIYLLAASSLHPTDNICHLITTSLTLISGGVGVLRGVCAVSTYGVTGALGSPTSSRTTDHHWRPFFFLFLLFFYFFVVVVGRASVCETVRFCDGGPSRTPT